MERTFFIIASLFGALSVAFGAFGAHALRGRIEESLLANYQTGVSYMFYHALALLAVAWALSRWPASSLSVWAGWLFVVGIVIFSGSLFVMAFTGLRWLGAITPIGGVAFIAGWLLLALAAWRG
ncbi:MAG: membrane protein [Chloroflexota bacterium]|nr:DUF423 domain-containing protein [Caldilinea sp.]GIK75568.1 MAG: membrane protein [Chloroflexota bacterium]